MISEIKLCSLHTPVSVQLKIFARGKLHQFHQALRVHGKHLTGERCVYPLLTQP